MKKVSCALIGPGQGPLVRTRGAGQLLVRGLLMGDIAVVTLFGSKLDRFEVVENGIHPFEECADLQVRYSGRSSSFIAIVEIGVA